MPDGLTPASARHRRRGSDNGLFARARCAAVHGRHGSMLSAHGRRQLAPRSSRKSCQSPVNGDQLVPAQPAAVSAITANKTSFLMGWKPPPADGSFGRNNRSCGGANRTLRTVGYRTRRERLQPAESGPGTRHRSESNHAAGSASTPNAQVQSNPSATPAARTPGASGAASRPRSPRCRREHRVGEGFIAAGPELFERGSTGCNGAASATARQKARVTNHMAGTAMRRRMACAAGYSVRHFPTFSTIRCRIKRHPPANAVLCNRLYGGRLLSGQSRHRLAAGCSYGNDPLPMPAEVLQQPLRASD